MYKFTIRYKSTGQKPGVVTYVSTESSILGDQISNEIFSARKSFKRIRWIL